MPRPCAATISPTAAAGVATGSSATSGTRPGRSLFVRLTGPDCGKGAAGKWTDAATGEHGDLLDLIALNRELERLCDVLDEARSFLSLPRTEPPPDRYRRRATGADRITRIRTTSVRDVAADCGHDRRNVSAQARHHGFARRRGAALSPALLLPARCRRADRGLAGADRSRHRPRRQRSPARIAPGSTRLATTRHPLDTPRRAMGHLLGHGVRFGVATDVMAAGEGIETMLSRAKRPAGPAHGRRALGQSPRRPSLPGNAATSLCRARLTIRPATWRWRP